MSTTESLMGVGRLSADPQKDKGLEVRYQLQLVTFEADEGGTTNWQGFIRVPNGTKLPTTGGLFKAKNKGFILSIEDGRTFKVNPEKIVATVNGQDAYPVDGSEK